MDTTTREALAWASFVVFLFPQVHDFRDDRWNGMRSATIVEIMALVHSMVGYGEMADCSIGAAFHFAPTEKFPPPDSSDLTGQDDTKS